LYGNQDTRLSKAIAQCVSTASTRAVLLAGPTPRPPPSLPRAPPHPPRPRAITLCVDAHGQQLGGPAQPAHAEEAAELELVVRGVKLAHDVGCVVLRVGYAGGHGREREVGARARRTRSPQLQLPPWACRSPRTCGAVRRRARDTDAHAQSSRRRFARRLVSYSHGLGRG
jgi:hypothetical protein